MSARQGKKTDVPVCDLIIDGKKPDWKLLPVITGISVDLGLNKAGMLTLDMESYDKKKDDPNWIDNDLLAPGREIEVKMGYGSSLKTMFFGDIIGINASFTSSRSPALSVRAYDRRHRLEKHTESRHFEKKKYSQIAQDIAGYWKLSSKVEDSQVVHEFVQKSNQSDMEFLEKLATEINYQVMVVGKKLLFERASNDAGEIMTLSMEKDLMDFSADLSLSAQASEVVVRGWDPAEKKEIVSKATAGSEASKMGGSVSASQLNKKLFGEAVRAVNDHPVATQAEADQIGLARLNEMSMRFVTAEGSVMGTTDLMPGKVIRITGVGKRFSGRYYVESATHRFDQQNGYSTKFTARRNAL